MNPKIFFCGDVHGNFEHLIQAVREHQPAALILLGDVQAPRPLEIELARILDETELWFVHGNHDTDREQDYDNLFDSSLASRNFHGKVIEVAGVRIAGLGGIFRSQIWRPPAPPWHESAAAFLENSDPSTLWRGGLPLKHRSSIFPEDYRQLLNVSADVLVTHEAPSAHYFGYGEIDALGKKIGVSKSFHGHQHDRLDYSRDWDRLGFQAYGVGFCGITDLEGNVIRAGDFDNVRSPADYEYEKAAGWVQPD